MKLTKKKIINIVFIIFCSIISLSVIFEVIFSTVEQRPPKVFGYSVSYVPTESMEPTIMTGDYVLFVQSSFDKVNVGDIIVYRSESGSMAGNFLIHRVLEKYENHLITQGDNNPAPDEELITRDMVYGKYVTTIGFLSIFSGGINRNMIFLIIVLVILLLIGMQIASMVLKYKRDLVAQNNKKIQDDYMEELRKEVLEEMNNESNDTSQ